MTPNNDASINHLATAPEPFVRLADLAEDVRAGLDIRNEFPEVQGLRTGLAPLDKRITEALMPGRLTVVGARSGGGKTAFVSQIGLQMSSQADVLYITLEDEPQDIYARWMAQVAREDVGEIRRGFSTLYPQQGLPATALAALTAVSQHSRLTVWSPRSPKMEQIVHAVQRWRQASGQPFGVIVIDQLSHIKDSDQHSWPETWTHLPTPDKYKPEHHQLEWKTEMARAIGSLTGCAVLLAVQLNQHRDEAGRPMQASVRGSQGIVQKADTVLLLHRPEQPARLGDGSSGDHVSLRCVKGRVTGEFDLDLVFEGAQQRFRGRDEDPETAWRPVPGPTGRELEGRRRLASLLRSRAEASVGEAYVA